MNETSEMKHQKTSKQQTKKQRNKKSQRQTIIALMNVVPRSTMNTNGETEN